MLAIGPMTRRAEDLMPLLRLLAGGQNGRRLGDVARVSIDGLQVTLVEGTSRNAMAGAVRDAREASCWCARVGGGYGTDGQHGRLGGRTAVLSADAAGRPGERLASDTGLSDPGRGTDPRYTRAYPRHRRAHPSHSSERSALNAWAELSQLRGRREKLIAHGRALADELVNVIGNGVLLHPAHPTLAPRHRHTYGRPWLMMPAAIFNMAGVPVTEVPLGLGAQGLPMGIQVAAGPGSDHLSIAIALELEAAFGGWTPPAGH